MASAPTSARLRTDQAKKTVFTKELNRLKLK